MDDLSKPTTGTRRRSTAASNPSKPLSDDLLRPQAFSDVFGGPPRTIFAHQLSATGCFYDDIFWQSEKAAPPLTRSGRNLPLFKIPTAKQISSDRCSRRKNSFFCDAFGWDSEKFMSSRSGSKTNSSSALSSEELSPLRPAVSDDGYDAVSSLASKLRPINVKSRWDSSRIEHEDQQMQQKLSFFPDSNAENEILEKFQTCPFPLSRGDVISESVNVEQLSFGAYENDVQFNSPSSVVSSERNVEISEIVDDEVSRHDEMEVDDFNEDELMSSYVIELDPCNREETTVELNDIDEAIAWAKEKFQKHSSQQKPTQEVLNDDQLYSEDPKDSCPPSLIEEEEETSLVDEKIRLWLSGKEADIRLLLSSLHHILWPNSGWMAIPLMNLIESSQVKKAYQKAVLFLHPDKLQQRGVTLPHKHIAEKAFAAIQDAWRTFVSLDISCR